jgi:DNA-binding CsgD family transcriptional regulator
MPHIDDELLQLLNAKFLAYRGNVLSPAERTEVTRIAQGLSCDASAGVGGVSRETIRARRKGIYRKLHVSGAHELLSCLLQVSLGMLMNPEQAREGAAQRAGGMSGPVNGPTATMPTGHA